ncbi:MAG: formate dehydrogenase accessory protein FdhE, partial [candidate division KSB1 bacterium]|nr:formate dehydrogenase accessory protein FdhE [candidate division KSB1 bacterium]
RDEQWLKGYCPICGNLPGMARLEQETGQRILWCSFCHAQWNFPRIQCPFCSNNDHDRLKYFFIEEESPYRVDVCENCGKYLKTIDERRLPEEREIYLPIEDLATYELDMAAEKEGYQSGQWWLRDKGIPSQ